MSNGVQYKNNAGEYQSTPPGTRPLRIIPISQYDGNLRDDFPSTPRSERRISSDSSEEDNRSRGRGRVVGVIVEDEPVTYFQTKYQRTQFVSKVYCILSLMLLVDSIFIVLALFVESFRNYLEGPEGSVTYIIALVLFLCVYMTLVCCPSCRLSSPQNCILLTLLTLSMGFMLAAISAHHSVQEILFAAIGTFLVTVSITIFAKCGTWDVTGYAIYLFVIGIVLLIGGFIIMIICIYGLCGSKWKTIYLVLSILFVLLFAMYLLYDTQMVIGGGRVQLSPDEYVLGAILIWIDIVYIFMCFTRISSYQN